MFFEGIYVDFLVFLSSPVCAIVVNSLTVLLCLFNKYAFVWASYCSYRHRGNYSFSNMLKNSSWISLFFSLKGWINFNIVPIPTNDCFLISFLPLCSINILNMKRRLMAPEKTRTTSIVKISTLEWTTTFFSLILPSCDHSPILCLV